MVCLCLFPLWFNCWFFLCSDFRSLQYLPWIFLKTNLFWCAGFFRDWFKKIPFGSHINIHCLWILKNSTLLCGDVAYIRMKSPVVVLLWTVIGRWFWGCLFFSWLCSFATRSFQNLHFQLPCSFVVYSLLHSVHFTWEERESWLIRYSFMKYF